MFSYYIWTTSERQQLVQVETGSATTRKKSIQRINLPCGEQNLSQTYHIIAFGSVLLRSYHAASKRWKNMRLLSVRAI
jgi:hypothetical protein